MTVKLTAEGLRRIAPKASETIIQGIDIALVDRAQPAVAEDTSDLPQDEVQEPQRAVTPDIIADLEAIVAKL